MKVVLLTANHPAADTENHVLSDSQAQVPTGSPSRPLSPANGPQTFSVDLAAGPLAAADLRGWGVGMLGTEQPGAGAPDRGIRSGFW